jgi:hypothetical protein
MEEITISFVGDLPSRFTGIVHFKSVEHWFENGKIHRLDGPAMIWPDGKRHYYVHGMNCSEENYWKHPEVIAAQKPIPYIEAFPNKCKVCGQKCRMFKKNVFCSNHKCKTRKKWGVMFKRK